MVRVSHPLLSKAEFCMRRSTAHSIQMEWVPIVDQEAAFVSPGTAHSRDGEREVPLRLDLGVGSPSRFLQTMSP